MRRWLFYTNQTQIFLSFSQPFSKRAKVHVHVYKPQLSSADQGHLLILLVANINYLHSFELSRLASYVSFQFFIYFISCISTPTGFAEHYLQLNKDLRFLWRLSILETPEQIEEWISKHKTRISSNAIRFAQVFYLLEKEEAKLLIGFLRSCAKEFRLCLSNLPLSQVTESTLPESLVRAPSKSDNEIHFSCWTSKISFPCIIYFKKK
jgi:hypothetical protein